MTIGDHLEENTFPVYRCKIKDLKGKILTFFAVALSRITGDMFCPLTGAMLKDLIPMVGDIESMSVKDPVDYLIGLDEAGLQPIRKQKSLQGGQFYVWENSFRRCIGGRHKLIASAPRLNSAAMFTKIATLFASKLQYNSLQMPNCPTYSKAMLQTNRKIAAKMPPGSEESSLTREHDFAAEEEWMATSEREDGPEWIRDVTDEDEVWGDEMFGEEKRMRWFRPLCDRYSMGTVLMAPSELQRTVTWGKKA